MISPRSITILLLASAIAAAQQPTRLDPTTMVVLGGGMSAGFTGFRLTAVAQAQAWPSLVAKQMGTILPLPTFRESGHRVIVNAFQPLPGLLPVVPQSGERGLPFPLFNLNLSVPFLKTGESLRVRPQPVVEGLKLIPTIEGDLKRTLLNSILGGPLLVFQQPILLTQVEYAEFMRPTVAFVQLGFEDVLDAALTGDTSRITSVASFTSDYTEVLKRMRGTAANAVALTVPDPLDTPYFATLEQLGQSLGRAPAELQTLTGLGARDVVTLGGMIEISENLRGRRTGPLSAGSVVPAATAAAIASAVSGYNNAIRTAAGAEGAAVVELADYLKQIRASASGIYGGGFYSSDGLFPTATGHALIANTVLAAVNAKFGTSFSPASVPAPGDGQ